MGRGAPRCCREADSGCYGGLSEVVMLAVEFLSWVIHGLERKGCVWEPGGLGDKQWELFGHEAWQCQPL